MNTTEPSELVQAATANSHGIWLAQLGLQSGDANAIALGGRAQAFLARNLDKFSQGADPAQVQQVKNQVEVAGHIATAYAQMSVGDFSTARATLERAERASTNLGDAMAGELTSARVTLLGCGGIGNLSEIEARLETVAGHTKGSIAEYLDTGLDAPDLQMVNSFKRRPFVQREMERLLGISGGDFRDFWSVANRQRIAEAVDPLLQPRGPLLQVQPREG